MTIDWQRYALDPAYREGVDDARADAAVTVVAASRKSAPEGDRLLTLPSEQTVSVECHIFITEGDTLTTLKLYPIKYPFSAAQLENELDRRLSSLFHCSPLPEEILGIPLPKGVSTETFWLLLHNVAGYQHRKSPIYETILDRQFRTLIIHCLDQYEDKHAAKRVIWDAVDTAFKRMELSGRVRNNEPKPEAKTYPYKLIKWVKSTQRLIDKPD